MIALRSKISRMRASLGKQARHPKVPQK